MSASTRVQHYTKNSKQLGKAGNERGAPPQKRAQQLGVQCRMVISENIVWTKHVIIRSIYAFTYLCINAIIINEKKHIMDMKKSGRSI